MATISFYGPRGSDQYWYIQETETLIQTGKPISNIYYAGLYWREGFNEQDNYFIHHTLAHYIVFPLALFFGAYSGWIFTSVLLIILGTCMLISATYKATQSLKVAVFIGMAFLLLPITVWQSFNILQESIIAAYMCFGVWIWERSLNAATGKVFFNLLGGLFGALGVFIHPIFAVWCIAWMVKIFFEKANIRSLNLWLPVAVTLLSLIVAQYCKNLLFPSKFFPSLSAMISNSSMTYYFNYVIPDASVPLIWNKFVTALKAQFSIVNTSVVFFYPFNILLVLFITAVIIHFKRNKFLKLHCYILPSFLLIGYFAMISLHQNQFRYSLIITPIILASLAMAFGPLLEDKLRGVKALICIVGFFSLLIITDVYLARHIAADARADAAIFSQRNQSMPAASKGQKMLLIFKSLDLSMGWALYPRPILFLPVGNLHLPASEVTIKNFSPKYVIIQKEIDDKVEKYLPLALKEIPLAPDRLFEVVYK